MTLPAEPVDLLPTTTPPEVPPTTTPGDCSCVTDVPRVERRDRLRRDRLC
ncbi:MAG: hypothetical protein ISS73_01115 [Pirellulales bacterium]|nr:hypothetical protein [Pirellulales bacterium]